MTDQGTGGLPPGYDVLAAREPERPQRRSSWAVVAGAAALVAALVAGVAYGVSALSGGGRQPEQALPAGAFAFADVDLDPPAGQKVDAFRFLRRFPSLRGRIGADDDLRRALFDSVAQDAGWADVDFDRDVRPWLGKRVAVGGYLPKRLGLSRQAAGGPEVFVVALQVGDEDRARAGLDRLVAADRAPGKLAYTVADGYALLAENRRVAEAAADRAQRAELGSMPSFAADMAGLGGGVASVWFDAAGIADLAPLGSALDLTGTGLLRGLGSGSPGRVAYVLRFDGPDVLEVAGRTRGTPDLAGPDVPVTGVADLPGSTVAAAGLGGGDGVVDPVWAALRTQAAHRPGGGSGFDEMVAETERRYGVALPADLKVLLGTNLLVALDRGGLHNGSFELGARVRTKDPERADALVARLTRALATREPGLTHRAVHDGYVVASTARQAERLSRSPTGARLGEGEAFRAALPDLEGARFALWLDLRAIIGAVGPGDAATGEGGAADSADTSTAADRDLRPLRAFGLTASGDGHGSGHFRARLVLG